MSSSSACRPSTRHADLGEGLFDVVRPRGLLSADRAARSPSADHYAALIFSPVRAALDGFEPAPDARLDHPYVARDRGRGRLVGARREARRGRAHGGGLRHPLVPPPHAAC
jgi:hypothetical protein